jgi:hypothetical protein
MKERWTKRLRPLDDGGPTDEVWRRAQRGPTRPHVPDDDPTPSTAARVTAGVTAIAVFAVAAALAWSAFGGDRGNEQERSPGSPDPLVGTILWPERTGTDLEAAQALVDAGDANVAWRLDPERVAVRFAEEVLGWRSPEGRWTIELRTLTGVQSHPLVVATLSWLPVPCPTPAPGANSNFPCPPLRLDQQLELVQPATEGPGGAWVVRSASSQTLVAQPPPLAVGDALPIGGDVGAVATLPQGWSAEHDGYRAAAGVQVGTGDGCDASSRTDVAPASQQRIDLPAEDIGAACSPLAPAYLWIASSVTLEMDPTNGDLMSFEDPFDVNRDPLPLLGLTAVPFRVSVPEDGDGSASPNPPTPSPTWQEADDIGLGKRWCEMQALEDLDLLGDGIPSTAWTGYPVNGEGRCPRNPGWQVAVDVTGDGSADAAWGPIESCRYTGCAPLGATDLDADGDQELVIHTLFSIIDHVYFSVRPGNEVPYVIEPILVAEPGHPAAGIQPGAPLITSAAGDAGYAGWIRCEG